MPKMMRSFALVLVLGACAGKPDAPRVELTDVGYTLHLPLAMRQSLDSVAPGFRMIRADAYRADVSQSAVLAAGGKSALFATVGDFDHDGTQDAVVEGTTPGNTALQVIAILNGPKPQAIPVTQFASYDADAVGIYLTPPPQGSGGAFELVAYPDSSLVYEYRDGGFVETRLAN